MYIGHSDEKPRGERRRLRFRLRTLFTWITALAIVAACVAGAFGLVLQVASLTVVILVIGWVFCSLAIGGPWIGLIWLCKHVTGVVRQLRSKHR